MEYEIDAGFSCPYCDDDLADLPLVCIEAGYVTIGMKSNEPCFLRTGELAFYHAHCVEEEMNTVPENSNIDLCARCGNHLQIEPDSCRFLQGKIHRGLFLSKERVGIVCQDCIPKRLLVFEYNIKGLQI